MLRRRVPAAVAAALLFAACSSSADSEPATTSAITTEAADSTTPVATQPETTTSTAATTTSVPDSTTTEPAPTTAADTTTVAPSADPETEVRATLDRSFADFSECLTEMPTCDPSILEETRAGELLDGNLARINEWNTAGYTVIDRDQYRYVIEAVEIGDDGTTANALVCLADGSKLIEPGGASDGTDLIVDDQFISGRESWRLQLGADGMWRAIAAPAVGVTEESDICPAA